MTDGYRPPKNKTKTRFVVCGSDDFRYWASGKKDARRMADHWDDECASLEPHRHTGPHKVFKVTTTREVVEVERPSEPPAHTVAYDRSIVIDGPWAWDTHNWSEFVCAFTPRGMTTAEARAILAQHINGDTEPTP